MCLEKQEFVDRCAETWSLPVVVPTKPTIKPKAKSTTLRAWTRRAERNVILPCMRKSNETFADTGETSALVARPHCWEEYWRFLENDVRRSKRYLTLVKRCSTLFKRCSTLFDAIQTPFKRYSNVICHYSGKQ